MVDNGGYVEDESGEDDADRPICPWCGESGRCPHLLLILDKTFPAVVFEHPFGVVDRVVGEMQRTVGQLLLRRGEDAPDALRPFELQDLVERSYEEFSPGDPDDPETPYAPNFMAGFVEYLCQIAGDLYEVMLIEGELDGPPGQSWAVAYLYADDVTLAAESLRETLDDHLAQLQAAATAVLAARNRGPTRGRKRLKPKKSKGK